MSRRTRSRASSQRKARVVRPAARTHIVPKGCKLNVTVPKMAGIYGELTTLLLSKHVHAIGVLLRVFLEMSVDECLINTAGVSLTFKEPKSGRMIDKKLKNKVEEAIGHMVSKGADDKDFKGIRTAMNDTHRTLDGARGSAEHLQGDPCRLTTATE